MHGAAEAADGSWLDVKFLVDTGADRTTFTADVVKQLGLEPQASSEVLGGLGGVVATVRLRTRLGLRREDGVMVSFHGLYAGMLSEDLLDMSVLGRDITDHFALIVDRPGDTVCLLGQAHRYAIEQR
jgi:hypothetical protein